MLLVFFLLFSILQRSLPSPVSHQALKSVFSNWSHLASSLRRSFRLFLILGGEIWEGSAFETIKWSCRVLSQDFVLTLILCFPRACISALGLMQRPWRPGFWALFTLPFSFAPWKTGVLLLSLILTTGSLPPFEKSLCLPIADKYLDFLVVKLHVLCTHSKLVQMERLYGFFLVSKAIHEFQVFIWLPGRVSFSFLWPQLTLFPLPTYLIEKIEWGNVLRYRRLFFAQGYMRSIPLSYKKIKTFISDLTWVSHVS